MEFIDGVGVTDTAALAALGLSRRSVMLLVAETFNEMIFAHGYVHCDPHAANMLVQKVVSLYGGLSSGCRIEETYLRKSPVLFQLRCFMISLCIRVCVYECML